MQPGPLRNIILRHEISTPDFQKLHFKYVKKLLLDLTVIKGEIFKSSSILSIFKLRDFELVRSTLEMSCLSRTAEEQLRAISCLSLIVALRGMSSYFLIERNTR